MGGVLAGVLLVSQAPLAADMLVYFGTYTGPKSEGIYVSRFDPESGRLSPAQLAAAMGNPSFLALHPSGRYLYAVGESAEVDGRPGGAVTAFGIDPESGKLQQISQQSSRGAGPCHISLDAAGRWALVANYGGGNLAVLPIAENGALKEAVTFIQHEGSSVHQSRQRRPHAHSINLDAAGKLAVAADLGLDKLMLYRFDSANGTLQPGTPPFTATKPGAGPRHFAFHPDQRHAFVINELDSTLNLYRYDPAQATLEEVQSLSTLPKDFQGNSSTAEVQVHPSGRFVYGSNRGHDSIAVYRFSTNPDRLEWVENEPTQGKTPRNFGIDPSGRWLLAANQESSSVVVFKIDPESGALTPANVRIDVGSPVCVKFLVR